MEGGGGNKNKDKNKAKARRHIYSSGLAGCGGKGEDLPKKNDGQEVQCPFCERKYKQDGRLKDHIKNKHDGGNAPVSTDEAADSTLPSSSADSNNNNAAGPSTSNTTNGTSALTDQPPKYFEKTPKTLISEWCQKNGKRPNPKFKHVQVEGGGGFHARAILPDPRDNAEDIIVWYRQAPCGSAVEAEQMASVAALHAVAGERRMDRLLKGAYRDEWLRLDVEAVEKVKHAKARAEREAAELRRREALVKKERRLQSVFMSEEQRRVVEAVIADDGNTDDAHDGDNDDERPNDGANVVDTDALAASLRALGFDEDDARRAAAQCGDTSEALDWLMLRVAESRLPARFRPEASARMVQVLRVGKGADAASMREAATRLSECGYAPAEVRLSLERAGDFEAALCQLHSDLLVRSGLSNGASLAHENGKATQQEEEDESRRVWEEEMEVLRAIYGDEDFERTSPTALQVKLRVEGLSGTTWLQSCLSAPDTRTSLPELARAVLRSATGALVRKRNIIVTDGSPMVHDITGAAVEALEEAWRVFIGERGANTRGSHSRRARWNVAAANKASAASTSNADIPVTDADIPPPAPPVRNPAEDARMQEDHRRRGNDPKLAGMRATRAALPAARSKAELLRACSASRVVVVCGGTGCGKTTQVGQYILEDAEAVGNGSLCNIICTQPRRISAVSVADRVASERGSVAGEGAVGYSVRLESRRGPRTRLLFCTAGVLLRRMGAREGGLDGVSHVIVDEVHERSLEADMLLLLLRELMSHASHLKLILMSATADPTLYVDYYANFGPVRVVSIPGFTHPVKEFYLEDAHARTGYRIGRGSRYARRKERIDATDDANNNNGENNKVRLPDAWDEDEDEAAANLYPEDVVKSVELTNEAMINYELIAVVVEHIINEERGSSRELEPLTSDSSTTRRSDHSPGAILVFLPGMLEIRLAQQALSSRIGRNDVADSLRVLPLHGSLAANEQRRVFERPPPGVRKVVLATNVAETSVTIDDVVYVVDTCRAKELRHDATRGLSALVEDWVSKASANQRRGRAGRVQPGCCFRLCSRRTFAGFISHTSPEVTRVPLERLCMQIKSTLALSSSTNSLQVVAARMPTPPDPEAVRAAIESLKGLGAFDERENLTVLGRHLVRMPVDARLGKMLVLAALLRCLEPVMVVAAAMSDRSPFVAPFDKRSEADAAKRALAGTSNKSDHLAVWAAFSGWLRARESGGYRAESDYCSRNFLSMQTLKQMELTCADYADTLVDLGFVPAGYRSRLFDTTTEGGYFSENAKYPRVVKAVLCAGLYPNVVRVQAPETTYKATEGGNVAKEAKAKEVKFYTRDDGRVFIHPSSVIFNIGTFESAWLVYSEKVKAQAGDKVYVRECSMVPAYSLLLFTGSSVSVQHESSIVAVDNGWVRFEAPARIGALVRALRAKVDQILLDKVANPAADTSGKGVLDVIAKLVATDGY
eukprot:jgi/Chlat1/311/Chrsp1S03185